MRVEKTLKPPAHRSRLVQPFIALTDKYFPNAVTHLDVGCGGLCNIFKEIYGEDNYTGLDVETCKYPVDVHGDAEHLPYEDNSFDVVTGWSLIEHLLNPYNGLCEMLRVSKIGVIIVTDLTKSNQEGDPTHLYCWSPKILRQLFKRLPATDIHVSPSNGMLLGVAYKCR